MGSSSDFETPYLGDGPHELQGCRFGSSRNTPKLVTFSTTISDDNWLSVIKVNPRCDEREQ